jgi:hypothetical protein
MAISKEEILKKSRVERVGMKVYGLERESKMGESLRELMEAALKAAKPCLEDWVATTGFGEVHRRDKSALDLINEVLRIYY